MEHTTALTDTPGNVASEYLNLTAENESLRKVLAEVLDSTDDPFVFGKELYDRAHAMLADQDDGTRSHGSTCAQRFAPAAECDCGVAEANARVMGEDDGTMTHCMDNVEQCADHGCVDCYPNDDGLRVESQEVSQAVLAHWEMEEKYGRRIIQNPELMTRLETLAGDDTSNAKPKKNPCVALDDLGSQYAHDKAIDDYGNCHSDLCGNS